ncbi:STN domain-containing protein [Bradyrhizobium roseum]|uniref:STN domain-containing protein n=1 Tax=Bradyrhizobium roseum TaxID=3056648 RepID=UPI00261B9A3F|nr:STN domain-containing protein [Bradyrhizobium roseus]WKA26117.1 STN domain-containing protein [Bradyrhizobium roseus]
MVAQGRSARLCRALLLGVGLALTSHGAVSQTRSPIQFAIAVQPLAAALDAYAVASGVELYYDGDLTAGRRSQVVEGRLVPEAALRGLLAGSGLVARATGPNSFVITFDPSLRLPSASHQSYFAVIQSRVSQALCAHPETRPGDTDLLLQLWISSMGSVQRAQLLDSPGGEMRESVFAVALRGIPIGAAPPSDLPQPITMAILARARGEPSGCRGASTTAVR